MEEGRVNKTKLLQSTFLCADTMSLESVLKHLWHDSVSKFNQQVKLYYKLNGHNVAIY